MGAGTEVLDVLTRIQSFNLLAHRFGIWVISIYRVRRASRKPGPGPGPNPDRTEPATQLMMTCIFQIFWFLLDRFGLPKIEKVFKSGWFKSCQVYNSSFLACWFWFLLDRFWLPKADKGIKSGWFQSFQFYRSDLLVWWLWFHLDKFWLPKIEKVFKSGWFKSCQVYNSSFLACWFWFLLDRFWLQKLTKESNLADSNHFNSIVLIS